MFEWLLGREERPRAPDGINVGWSHGADTEGRWGVSTMVFVAERAPRPWSNRDVWIFHDGAVRLEMPQHTCTEWPELLEHVRAERVVSIPPNGALVVLNGRSPVSLSRVARLVPEWEVDVAGLLADLQDMRSAMQGGPRAVLGCRASFRQYLVDPNERTRAELQIAYRNVPPQMRPSVLDNLEENDEAIRMLLSNDLADGDREQIVAYCRKTFGHLGV